MGQEKNFKKLKNPDRINERRLGPIFGKAWEEIHRQLWRFPEISLGSAGGGDDKVADESPGRERGREAARQRHRARRPQECPTIDARRGGGPRRSATWWWPPAFGYKDA